MVLNTLAVGAAVTPTVLETYFSHYLNRKSLREKPTAHISYHEGLQLVRRFLHYASLHTVDDLQGFTAQWVPVPHWVMVEEVSIPALNITRSAELVQEQLGHRGIDKVGGKLWWQWRRDEAPPKAEWIEMRKDHQERQRTGDKGQRVMLYVHGGAYYFGSVDEHRYQMQRHARKLRARVLAPRYRLAPQFPFPCGLHDCLAAYLWLIEQQDPSTILLAGDSAGGGMVLSMLVILRDRGLPLPAGAVLISPWVDLTHSFPSVAGDGQYDYIPAHGFWHKPNMTWPPPNSRDMEAIAQSAVQKLVNVEKAALHAHERGRRKSAHKIKQEQEEEEAIRSFSVDHNPGDMHMGEKTHHPFSTEGLGKARPDNPIPGAGSELSVLLDGNLVDLHDQIQVYTTNQMLSHPLVSPVLQPSLGGLPPLLIQVGGGELLRDEQIYLAHKAANPSAYPPGEAYLDEHDPHHELVSKYEPTDVQLQVWDDLCHVAPTLSFTRPAKYMYRSVAQFGAWALAQAQKAPIDILDDDNVSVISSGTEPQNSTEEDLKDHEPDSDGRHAIATMPIVARNVATPVDAIGKAGDALPAYHDHMIRQRIDRRGAIYPLSPPNELPALQMRAADIGIIKPGPVRKWLAAKTKWDSRFAREKRAVQTQRVKEMAAGYDRFEGDEVPPPTALAGRRKKDMPREPKQRRGWGLSMWSGWGSKHDEMTLGREEKAKATRRPSVMTVDPAPSRPHAEHQLPAAARRAPSTLAAEPPDSAAAHTRLATAAPALSTPPTLAPGPRVPDSDYTYLAPSSSRPHNGTVAYPFSLAAPAQPNASTTTLTSDMGADAGTDSEPGTEAAGADAADGNAAGARAVAEHGNLFDAAEAAKRPQPQTFVTASEGARAVWNLT
ncbi:Alpha/Beta hydrolase protein [Cryomyces antarcticus]